jgi:hypothetical protein
MAYGRGAAAVKAIDSVTLGIALTLVHELRNLIGKH